MQRTRIIETYILTFNKPTTPTSIKIGNINAKIEIYIPNPLRCQKYGHHKDKLTRLSMWKIKSHRLEYQNPFTCTGEHSAYSWECEMWKKEKKE